MEPTVSHITVDGIRYRYEVSKMNVTFTHIPVYYHLEIWKETGERILVLLLEGREIEDAVRVAVEGGKWSKD